MASGLGAVARLLAAVRAAGSPPSPDGPDWNQYFAAGWKVTHGIAIDYPRFRLPLYPWLVATLGEARGYQAAAEALSLGAVAGCLLLAAVLARLLAGPWAAVAAPWLALLAPALFASAQWSSEYAPLAFCVGLALTLGAATARTGHPALALAGGLAGGLALAVDVRGASAVAVAAALTAVGSRRPGRAGLAVVLFAAGAALSPALQARLAVIPMPAADSLVLEQRQLALDEVWQPLPAAVKAACAGTPRDRLPQATELGEGCVRASFRSNAGVLGATLPGGAVGALGLALMSALAAAGWRGRATCALAHGGPLLAGLLAAGLLPELPQRYLLVYAVPFACLAPAAAGLLLARLGRVGSALAVIAACAAVVQGARVPLRAGRIDAHNADRRAAVARLVEVALPAGGTLLDCSMDAKVGLSLAPRFAPADPLLLGEMVPPAACRAWAEAPPARPLARVDDCARGLLLGAGWSEVGRHDGLCVTAWGGPATP